MFLFNDLTWEEKAEVWVAAQLSAFILRVLIKPRPESWPAFFNSLQLIVQSNGVRLSLILSFALLPSQKWEVSSRQRH